VNDQAAQLRRLIREAHRADAPPSPHPGAAAAPPPRRPALAGAVAVTSGKGGVGKTNIAVNLAVALARLGRRVCLLDADLGLANADVLCNLTPRLTLEQVVAGRCRLSEAMLLAPGGFRLIPGASGVVRLADLDAEGRCALFAQMEALERVAEILVIDTAAGLSRNVLAFASAAGRTIVVTTPEPTAMADAYGMIKALWCTAPDLRVDLLVNMAGAAEAAGVFGRVDRVSRAFLGGRLGYAGSVPRDAAVMAAVRDRVPFVLLSPEAAATMAVRRLAGALAGVRPRPAADPAGEGFFARLAEWFARKEPITGPC
jgi:flagellar biosynthesis protein FlhG